ncbi:membrane protein insertion efficiency factor YidD [Massilia sp. Root418]|uniref:membrane protein insertion efficiency factor YidD n=1 Tax=Massilia sp. Root418 TaxID=1736532 RepID=UPI0009E708AD|nr:membrane protein insertion efficiency factor YidD [Massilia sp. Root418]
MYINFVRRSPQWLALWLIRLYQRHLSPRKGFVCAFRVHTGRDGCSAYGLRVIARFGLRRGLALLDRRLSDCGQQHRLHAPPRAPARSALRRQAGFCDLPSCDLPSCDVPSGGGAVCRVFDPVLEALNTFFSCADVCNGCDCRRDPYRVSQSVKDKYKRNRPVPPDS